MSSGTSAVTWLMTIDLCTWDLKEAGKNATCFATLLQNKFNSNVVHFTAHFQTCLVTTQVVAVCEELLKKVERSCTFCDKISTCCTFYGPKTNLFCSQWLTCNSCVISSNQNLGMYTTGSKLIFCKTGLNMGSKINNNPFQLVLRNVLKQVAHFSCLFYSILERGLLAIQGYWFKMLPKRYYSRWMNILDDSVNNNNDNDHDIDDDNFINVSVYSYNWLIRDTYLLMNQEEL